MKTSIIKMTLILTALLLLINLSVNAQVLISESSGNPNASAMLEIQSDSRGILIPRLTTEQRNLISSPAEGLLVYDSDLQSFFIYGKKADETVGWYNISDHSSIWSRSDTMVYLSQSNYNVGIGTTTPDRKLVIQANNDNDTLMEVLDKDGNPLMIITPKLTKFNFIEGEKGIAGGFAVGRFSSAKGNKAYTDTALFLVTPDSTRVYTAGASGVSGGFAVGRFSSAKDGKAPYINKYFFTDKDSTRIYYDGSETKGAAGGFAVGRFSSAKDPQDNVFYVDESNSLLGAQAGKFLQNTPYTGEYNTFLGFQSGYLDTVGSNNVFIGHTSGYNNTDGNYNVFMGNQAGYSNTGSGGGISGSQNVFLGYQAGYANTTGADNVMIGWLAGHENTTAGSNICIGSKAGYSNTTSIHNIFMGEFAGEYHKSGTENIYIGFRSGQGPNTTAGGTGEANVFLGTSTGINNTSGAFNIFLGNEAGYNNDSSSNNIFLGRFAGYNHKDTPDEYKSDDNIFIGNGAGYGNAAGETSVSNLFIGVNAGFSTQSGQSNVFIGNRAGYSNSSSSQNVFVGNNAGYDNTTGQANVFVGDYAGESNISGNYNVFLGRQTGDNLQTGDMNIMIGDFAGHQINGTSSNIFVGADAARYAVGGNNNIFLGVEAGLYHLKGNNNIFFGNGAGKTTSADPGDNHDNIFIGTSAGASTEYGNDNVFLGYESGFNNNGTSYAGVWGSQNVFLGFRSGYSNTTGNRNVYIGYLAGFDNLTENSNVFIGDGAGEHNQDGGNVFVGSGSGRNGVNGGSNTAVGYASGNNAEGNSNTFLGFYSGNNTGNGTENVYLGTSAGSRSNGGNGNIYIGYNAGSSYTVDNPGSDNVYVGKSSGFNSTGSYNVFIGKDAGLGETGSNLLFIDNSSTSTPLIHGNFSTNTVTIYSNLSVNAAYTFPTSDGANGQVIQTNGSGTLSWVSGSTFADNLGNHSATQDLDMNTYDILDIGNIGIGTSSPDDQIHIEGTGNAGTKISAGDGDNASLKLFELTSGSDYGYEFNYEGSGTVDRLDLWSRGYSGNEGIRMSVLKTGNIGIGTTNPSEKLHVAGDAIIGSGSTGYDGSSEHIRIAGRSDTWYLAVRNETTVGETDFFIGQTDLEDGIFLIENDGDVGIGTYSPDNRLDVNGKISLTQSSGDEMVIINDDVWQHSTGNQDFGDGGEYFIMASREGQSETGGIYGDGDVVTIWSAGDGAPGQPAAHLYILEEDAFDNDGDPYNDGAIEIYLNTSGVWTVSDKNKKENIVKIENAGYKISQLNGYTYNYKLKHDEKRKGDNPVISSGLLAQELETVLPEAVQSNDYGEKFVNYSSVIPLLIEGMKEQNTKIEELEKQIQELKQLRK